MRILLPASIENKAVRYICSHQEQQTGIQEECYQIACDKSYYILAAKAHEEDVQHVKRLFTSEVL